MSALVPAAASAVVGLLWATSGLPFTFLLIIVPVSFSIAWSQLDLVYPAQRVRAWSASRVAGYALILCSACGVGVLSARAGAVTTATRLPVADQTATHFRGSIAEIAADGETVFLALEWAGSAGIQGSAGGPLAVRVDAPWIGGAGDEVAVDLRSGDGGAWRDDRGRLWVRGSLRAVSSRPESGGRTFARLRESVRSRFATSIQLIAGRSAPLLQALLLGDSDGIDPRTQALFRRAGAVHLLALSGMHLAVIAMLVHAVFRPLAGVEPAAWAAVVASLLYLALAGPRPGLVRAAIMVTLATVAARLDVRRPLVELLAATFLVQLIIQPEATQSIGFQLSYFSLLGISLVATSIAASIGQYVPPVIGSPLAAGVGAQLFTAPLVVSRFGVWYPVGVVSSLIMGPLVLVFMTLGLVAVLLHGVGLTFVAPLARPVLELLAKGAQGLGWLFAGAPSLRPERPALWIGLAWGAVGGVLLGGLYALYRKPREMEVA